MWPQPPPNRYIGHITIYKGALRDVNVFIFFEKRRRKIKKRNYRFYKTRRFVNDRKRRTFVNDRLRRPFVNDR